MNQNLETVPASGAPEANMSAPEEVELAIVVQELFSELVHKSLQGSDEAKFFHMGDGVDVLTAIRNPGAHFKESLVVVQKTIDGRSSRVFWLVDGTVRVTNSTVVTDGNVERIEVDDTVTVTDPEEIAEVFRFVEEGERLA